MLRYMLDTNILIYTIKNKPEAVRKQFEAHDGEMCASSVTAMELLYGAHKSQFVRRNLDVIEGLLGRIDILDFDLSAAEHAGQIRAELATSGTSIGPFDVMIAGHARSRGMCLITNNEGEFSRVSGLRLGNWAK
ncbi:tRNA(fMet)-specific endonuclease VapC [Roseivivax sp. THAF197b]|uniref:type II toxin-antitoxin system tRNA(fMet)-specific endonuclease VapC n=1 Tax=Roseivivax sp. THAF197b TaxID=2588299 RepID=UPI0012681B50|nr:tRNA(fMet)-specific endonuclease VapC [Roseivivax sp. THAF197b]QFS84807.1 tRNA(fMet)-specific endonuclease VapC [Roseivivax sp. THAF197b]